MPTVANHTEFLRPVFSKKASESFNRRMKVILQDFSRDVAGCLGENLRFLVLGGSYGRGEGDILSNYGQPGSGVWSCGEHPVEDVDVLMLLAAPAYSCLALDQVVEKYSSILGVQVHLVAALTETQLKTMGGAQLKALKNCRVLYGDPFFVQEILAQTGADKA